MSLKKTVPLATASFERRAFSVVIDGATLGPSFLTGEVASSKHRIAWQLRYTGSEKPLLLLPLAAYGLPFLPAKTLVGLPLAIFEGSLSLDETPIDVVGWVGSQNHNWGVRLADQYAWGQVAGFDTHPGSFLEIRTARLAVGPVLTPSVTALVLRHEGRDDCPQLPGRANS